VVSEVEIEAALARLAREITARLGERRSIVMTVLHGGLIFAGHLLVRLPFPLDCDYVHVGRYGPRARGRGRPTTRACGSARRSPWHSDDPSGSRTHRDR
jgi:hypoxanthine-guanine phosphoribosyltransferase